MLKVWNTMYFIIRINETSPRIHGDSRNGSKHIVVKFKFIARLNIANLPVQSLSDFQGAYKIQIWIVFLYRTDVQDQESQYFQGWLEGIGVVETVGDYRNEFGLILSVSDCFNSLRHFKQLEWTRFHHTIEWKSVIFEYFVREFKIEYTMEYGTIMIRILYIFHKILSTFYTLK